MMDIDPLLCALLDAIPYYAAVLDEQGTLLVVNAAWRDCQDGVCFPGAHSEIRSDFFEICEEAHHHGMNDADQLAAGLRDILSAQQQQFQMEYQSYCPEGKHWYLCRLIGFSVDDVRRVFLLYEDITASKHLQEELRKYREHLGELVEVRTAELTKQNYRLQQELLEYKRMKDS